MRSSPRLPSALGKARFFTALGVFSAAFLAVNLNLLSARWGRRWDFTSQGLYTLSEPTQRILSGLSEPVTVAVFLSRSDPLTVSVRHMLAAYSALSPEIKARFIDPDQSPAEFSAAQKQYGILVGKAEDGRLVTDASVVIESGDRHWYVTPEDMTRFDPESGQAQPSLEQALTEGIANVLERDEPTVCFSHGHQELGLGDAGPQGLSELRERIEKDNYRIEERDFPLTPSQHLSACRLLVVAGPRLPFAPADALRMAEAMEQGMSALLLLSPILDESERIRDLGLGPALEVAGIEVGKNLIVETDDAARLPRGAGEVFFAAPKPHPVTQGLVGPGAEPLLRVLVSEAQGVTPRATGASALLESSDRALALTDVTPVLEGRSPPKSGRGRHALSAARELEKKSPGGRPARVVVVGAANLAFNDAFRDAALYGDRLFVENAVAWLSARPTLLSVPEKRGHPVGLALTEESLSEVLRYVLLYMPGSAALLGIVVALRRRAVERRSRREPPTKGES